MVGLHDLASHRQAETQANVPCGEKWSGSLLHRLRSKTPAIVLHFDFKRLLTAAVWFGLQPNANLWIARVGLQSIKHDFGQRMFERGAISVQDDRFAGAVIA